MGGKKGNFKMGGKRKNKGKNPGKHKPLEGRLPNFLHLAVDGDEDAVEILLVSLLHQLLAQNPRE